MIVKNCYSCLWTMLFAALGVSTSYDGIRYVTRGYICGGIIEAALGLFCLFISLVILIVTFHVWRAVRKGALKEKDLIPSAGI
jgi:hypothetical protein